MTLRAAGRWLMEYALATIAAAVILFVVAAGIYAWLYHRDQSGEEIVDEAFELISLTETEAVLHITGRKRRGHPIAFTVPRTCPMAGAVRSEVGGPAQPCTPGETVEVMLSPSAYGIRADGTRRLIGLGGGVLKSYPDGKFDAGRWTFDITPRWSGDPPIYFVSAMGVNTRRGRVAPVVCVLWDSGSGANVCPDPWHPDALQDPFPKLTCTTCRAIA